MPICDWRRVARWIFHDLHKANRDEIREEPFELPADKPLTIAAYCAGPPQTAYVEPVVVGNPLSALPIFVDQRTCIPAPLQRICEATWAKCPGALKDTVGNPCP